MFVVWSLFCIYSARCLPIYIYHGSSSPFCALGWSSTTGPQIWSAKSSMSSCPWVHHMPCYIISQGRQDHIRNHMCISIGGTWTLPRTSECNCDLASPSRYLSSEDEHPVSGMEKYRGYDSRMEPRCEVSPPIATLMWHPRLHLNPHHAG